MRTGWLTGILLAVAAVLLLAVPPLREAGIDLLKMYVSSRSTFPAPKRREQIARAHPRDAEIWLGFAEFIRVQDKMTGIPGFAEEPVQTSAEAAYEKAIELAPNSVAPRFRHALFYLEQAGSLDREQTGLAEAEPPQADFLAKARLALWECREMAPENAACDYLLAWTYLAKHRDQEGFLLLRSALKKPGWSMYRAPTLEALLRLEEATDSPQLSSIAAEAVDSYSQFPTFSFLRNLTQTLAALAEDFRAAGQHDQAILCYESGLRLGYLMRTQAYSIIEGLVGVAVSYIATGPLSAEQKRKIEHSTQDPEVRYQREREARVAKLDTYLRRHGRADLADFVASELEAGARWKEQCMKVSKQLITHFLRNYYAGGTLNCYGVWVMGGTLLALGILVGLVSLVVLYWRERPVASSWSYLQWLVLLGVCLLPGQIVAAALTLRLENIPQESWELFLWLWLPASWGAGVLLWLVGVLILSLRNRTQQPEAQRLGRARSYLASLRMLIPPTLAALVLLSVLSLWPVQRNWERFADQQRQIIIQGEVKYWGIGTEDFPRPAPPR